MQSLFKQISTACESWLQAKDVGKEMNNQDATLNITQIFLKYLLKFLSVLILIFPFLPNICSFILFKYVIL